MALRISSAEMVSSAMAGVLFLLVRVCGLGGSADEPPAGGLEPVGDAAVDDLVADADDQATQDVGGDGHLQPDRPPVEAAEELRQPLLLCGGQLHRGGHVRNRLPAPGGGGLREPLDGDLSRTN